MSDKLFADPDNREKNLELWHAVERSEERFLKKMTHGAKLTTIAAYSQILKATEVWGPMGSSWGLKHLNFGYLEGYDDKGNPVKSEIWLETEFFHPSGAFPISVDMDYRARGDCRKKLTTDAITKSLSYLGFNADVYLNELKFVDDKTLTRDDGRKKSEYNELLHPDTKARLIKMQKTGIINRAGSWQVVELVKGDSDKLDRILEVLS